MAIKQLNDSNIKLQELADIIITGNYVDETQKIEITRVINPQNIDKGAACHNCDIVSKACSPVLGKIPNRKVLNKVIVSYHKFKNINFINLYNLE